MRTAKALGGAAALMLAALVGGSMISSTLAESPSSSPSAAAQPSSGADASYCEVFRSQLADELNVSEPTLESAVRAAAEDTIEAAVKNGDLTQDVADRLKQRLSNASNKPCIGLGPRLKAFKHGFVRGLGAGDLLSTAADALHMQTAELVAQLHSGTSLTAIAKAQGVDYSTVSKAVVAAAKADLDAAVAAGKITQQREDRLIEKLKTALDNGLWPRGGPQAGM